MSLLLSAHGKEQQQVGLAGQSQKSVYTFNLLLVYISQELGNDPLYPPKSQNLSMSGWPKVIQSASWLRNYLNSGCYHTGCQS